VVRLDPDDVSLELLIALATLTPLEREAWIDAYLAQGKRSPNYSTGNIASANRKLRRHSAHRPESGTGRGATGGAMTRAFSLMLDPLC
jgi:hypothetical protein